MSLTSKPWIETRATLQRLLDATQITNATELYAYARLAGAITLVKLRLEAGQVLVQQGFVWIPVVLDSGHFGDDGWLEGLVLLHPTHPLRDAQDGRPGRG